MKLLNYFFTLILAEKGNNWLSVKFHKYQQAKTVEYNNRWIAESCSKKTIESMGVTHFFEVPGAGHISLSDGCHSHTGGVFGFEFGASWGKYGFCGGVIGRSEAKRLAEIILRQIKKCDISEEEELVEWEKEFEKMQERLKI